MAVLEFVQDRNGNRYSVGAPVYISGTVLKIEGSSVTVLVEDVGAPNYVPQEITVHPKQTVYGV